MGVVQLILYNKTGRTSDFYNPFYGLGEGFDGIGDIPAYQVMDSVRFIESSIYMSRPCQFLTYVYTKVLDRLQSSNLDLCVQNLFLVLLCLKIHTCRLQVPFCLSLLSFVLHLSSWNPVSLLPIHRIFRSSANRYESLNLRTYGRSLLSIQTRRGPRRDPWGVPFMISRILELVLRALMNCDLLWR